MDKRRYLFVIKSSPSIILSPFSDSSLYKDHGAYSLLGRYGTGDMPVDTEALRGELNKAMEAGAREYYSSKGYYMRIILSASIFIAIYLFASIVIRDPIPLLDELLLSGVAALLYFFWSERRALRSNAHTDTVLSLRKALDLSFFKESRVVDIYESLADESLSLGPASFYKAPSQKTLFSAEEREEAEALCAALAKRWRRKAMVAELYEQSVAGSPSSRLLDALYKRLGPTEASLALAYLKLLALVQDGVGDAAP
jgi:hypothetical protein